MYQHRSFFEYVSKQDIGFLEMAQLKKEDAIQFDEYDFKYLMQFSPERARPKFPEEIKSNVWMYAIMYRYSPAVLMHPEMETHSVSITAGSAGVKQQTYHFDGIKTYTPELLSKLEDRYDIEKINLKGPEGAKAAASPGRVMARKAAIGAIEYLADKSKKIPALHINSALSAERKVGRRVQPMQASITDRSKDAEAPVGDREFVKHNISVREPITLDDDDKAFLAWFDAHPEYPKLKAFQRRYNNTADGLVNDRQASKVIPPGTEPGQVYNIEFPGGVIAKGVPVNAQRLKQRIAHLLDRGIDLAANPLSNQSAKGWIQKGVWKPWLGQSGVKNKESSFDKEFSSINRVIEAQNDWLKHPETESPFIWDRNIPNFSKEVPWMDVLRQEAKYVARKVYNKAKGSKAFASIQGIYDQETLEAEIWEYLASEKIFELAREKKGDYSQQSWRLTAAQYNARDLINIAFNQQKGDRTKDLLGKRKHTPKSRFGGPNQEIEDEPITADDREADAFGSTVDEPLDEPKPQSSTTNAIIDLLKATPEAAQLPPKTDWGQLAQDFIDAVNKWQDENKHSQINQTITMMIAKDVVAPYIPAVAAERPPVRMLPKFNRGTAAGYGGSEEADADDLANYRRKRF